MEEEAEAAPALRPRVVKGLRFRVLGFRVLGFRVWGLGFRVLGF